MNRRPSTKTTESSSLTSSHDLAPSIKPSLPRVESLPNLSQLHLKNPTDWSSVVIPQPRKALPLIKKVAVKALIAAKSVEETAPAEISHEDEALSELLEIIHSSSARSATWLSTDSPSPFEIERSSSRHHFALEEEEGDEMDTPSLSFSPGLPHILGRSKSSDLLLSAAKADSKRYFDFALGTPPSRAPNPLALSCHFASLEQGAELDLLRPSPPIYDSKGPHGARL